ncbi:hypothetical protein IU468_19970 [Nocardia farcinica]|uniref:hypothetical protein n=1 Tax=Nocardia farcinica TaxID=37329 RepID=UPI0018945E32|nr:hypothetical protein [Nocardia farcinica]MBF6258582.1 hypothetical protein [Nocardia farcinica]
MRPQVAALAQAAEQGSLRIDGVLIAEGAHERCARRYEQLAEQVEAQLAVLAPARSLPGFGGFDSGAMLRSGFEDKAGAALRQLREYATAARELAAVFRAAAAAYTAADTGLAAAVRAVDPADPQQHPAVAGA